jgi:hypothetical protein
MPIKPPSTSPNANPKPKSHHATHPTHASNRFLMRILLAFLNLIDPHSTSANPNYIKKIIAAEVMTQTALIASSGVKTALL